MPVNAISNAASEKGKAMDAIKTVGLCKSYGKKRAVDNLSFTIGSGEIYTKSAVKTVANPRKRSSRFFECYMK